MPHIRVAALALSLAASLGLTAQQPPATPAAPTPADQKCVVAGHVTNSVSGEPVKKVSVRLMRNGPVNVNTDSGPQAYTAISEADGSFRIEGVDPGRYMLSGQKTGFIYTNYGAKKPLRQGTVLTLSPSQQMTDINLALFPQAVISGKVVDEDGDPVGGAMVQAYVQSWQRGKLRYMPRGATSANDLGEYRMSGLAPGKYYIAAQKMNFGMADEEKSTPGKPEIRPVRTFYPEATSLATASPVEVQPAQDLSGMDIRVHSAPTYHIRGKIAGNLPNSDNQRISVSTTARDEDSMFMFAGQSMVKSDHTFDISGVAPGSYMVNVFGMGGTFRVMGQQPVDVGQGDANDVVVNIVPAGSMHGQVHIEGTPQAGAPAFNMTNVTVRLTPEDMRMMGGPPPNGKAKQDGSFTLDNVAPGKYSVNSNAPQGTYLKSIRFGSQDILGKTLDLSGGAGGDLELTFRYGPGEVDATVQPAQDSAASSNGQPAALPSNISVVLIPDVLNEDGSGIESSNANQNGTSTLKNIPPGHYRAYAIEDFNYGAMQNPDVQKQLEGKGTEVELKENDKKQIQLPIITSDDMQQILARLGLEDVQ